MRGGVFLVLFAFFGTSAMVDVGWGMFCFIMGIVFVCVIDPWNDDDRI